MGVDEEEGKEGGGAVVAAAAIPPDADTVVAEEEEVAITVVSNLPTTAGNMACGASSPAYPNLNEFDPASSTNAPISSPPLYMIVKSDVVNEKGWCGGREGRRRHVVVTGACTNEYRTAV